MILIFKVMRNKMFECTNNAIVHEISIRSATINYLID